jgi:hypothetical protein
MGDINEKTPGAVKDNGARRLTLSVFGAGRRDR